jgi:hypothetical protein
LKDMDSRFNPYNRGASGGGDYEEFSINPSQGGGGDRRGEGDYEAFSIKPRQGGGGDPRGGRDYENFAINPRQGGVGGSGSSGRKYDKIARDGRPVWEHIRDRAETGQGNPAMLKILAREGYI